MSMSSSAYALMVNPYYSRRQLHIWAISQLFPVSASLPSYPLASLPYAMCPIPSAEVISTPQLSSAHPVIHNAAHTTFTEEDSGYNRSPLQQRPVGVLRCRRRSRSSSPGRSRCPHPHPASPSPCFSYIATQRRLSRSRSLSPVSVISVVQPGPSQIGSPPSWCAAGDQPSQVPQQPADVLTFDYNESIAYALAAKTYDETIDTVLELWPELRQVERDQIRLFLTDSDHLVRIPRMTWSAVLSDIACYEVVHVQVEQPPQNPPLPHNQGKDKENQRLGDNNEKERRMNVQFSSIRRIFFR